MHHFCTVFTPAMPWLSPLETGFVLWCLEESDGEIMHQVSVHGKGRRMSQLEPRVMSSNADLVVRSRVMVAERYDTMRQALCDLCATVGYQVVGATGSVSGLLQLLDELNVPPDVVLLDLELPGVPGLELVRLVHASHPDVELVATTSIGHSAVLQEEAFRAGAQVLVVKGDHPAVLLDAIAHACDARPGPSGDSR